MLFMSCVCHAFMSVHCYLVITCWERADLLALVCVVLLCFCHFPHVVSCVRCGTCLYRFLIFATFFTFITSMMPYFVLSVSLCLLTGISSGLGCTLGVILLLCLSQTETMVNR